jgi:hypothetical protein
MIFNKNQNGADELKSLLGFVFASNSFDNIATDISLAERKIKMLIGQTIWSLAETHYQGDDYLSTDNDADKKKLDALVQAIQLPVAYLAVASYAPHADVTHSDKGRQIMVGEKEKPAFEWQIERDNKALRAKAAETTDILLEVIETDFIDAWKETPEFAAIKQRLIPSAREFDKIFPINQSRALYIALGPFMAEVERLRILPAVGQANFDKLLNLLKGETLTPPDDVNIPLLLARLRPPLAFFTLAAGVQRLSIELLPDGIVQSFESERMTQRASRPAEQADRWELSRRLTDEAERMMLGVQDQVSRLAALAEGTTFVETDPMERHTTDNKFFRP